MVWLGGFIGRLLGPLIKTGLPLTKNVLKLLAKSILIPLGLTPAASTTYAAIQMEIFGSGMNPSNLAKQTTLRISNAEKNDIMKIVKSLEEPDLSIKDVRKTIKNEASKQKGRFLGMLLGRLGANLLGNFLTVKGVMRTGKGAIRAGEGVIATSQVRDTIRVGQWITLCVNGDNGSTSYNATYFDSFRAEHIPKKLEN